MALIKGNGLPMLKNPGNLKNPNFIDKEWVLKISKQQETEANQLPYAKRWIVKLRQAFSSIGNQRKTSMARLIMSCLVVPENHKPIHDLTIGHARHVETQPMEHLVGNVESMVSVISSIGRGEKGFEKLSMAPLSCFVVGGIVRLGGGTGGPGGRDDTFDQVDLARAIAGDFLLKWSDTDHPVPWIQLQPKSGPPEIKLDGA
ncbi:hypothetical protein H4Q26_010412 [Puccinia striiformis f. sp. tritici PST-130]|nr:hypothetical protein H4Q26_010412 [Puccinia striiformis f. sp. tritici PST-130]